METRFFEVELEDFIEITDTENTLAGEIFERSKTDNIWLNLASSLEKHVKRKV